MATSPLQVQGTNDNSTLSKLSTAQSGYFDDPFVKYFVSKKAPGRAPLIHWGYWIRFTAVDSILKRFLQHVEEQEETSQIISLGAGFDTSYFRLKSSTSTTDQKTNQKVNHLKRCHYYEVDYPTVITRKHSIIESTPTLQELVSYLDYTLIGCDMTQLKELEESLLAAGVSNELPTLLLAEVVLTYIPPHHVDNLLNWTSKFFTKALLCVYEQVNPYDGFGQVMLKHFRSLSSPLMNIEHFPTTQAQCQRYLNAGWSEVYSCDMNQLYFSLPKAQNHIMSLEPFDEYEEWHLKCHHYHLICALTLPAVEWSPDLITAPLLHIHTSSSVDKREDDMLLHQSLLSIKCDASCNHLLLKRYGHASVLLKDQQTIMIYGGFGVKESSQAHGRLDNLVLLKLMSSGLWETQEIISNCLPGPLMYHSMTILPGDKGVLLIGGRTSPKQPNCSPYVLSLDTLQWTAIDYKGDKLNGRWRHSVTLIDSRYALIIGGCTVNGSVLDDMIVCDTQEWTMKKLSLCLPEGRHSHLAVEYESNILIFGGLNKDLLPLSTCLQIRQRDCQFRDDNCSVMSLEFTPLLPAKYSMSGSFIGSHILVAVGGVSICNSPDVLVINIQKRTWTGICFKYPIEVPIPLLCGHTSHVLPTTNGEVVCVGGGGNCFSFGTHFNTIPFIFTPMNCSVAECDN